MSKKSIEDHNPNVVRGVAAAMCILLALVVYWALRVPQAFPGPEPTHAESFADSYSSVLICLENRREGVVYGEVSGQSD